MIARGAARAPWTIWLLALAITTLGCEGNGEPAAAASGISEGAEAEQPAETAHVDYVVHVDTGEGLAADGLTLKRGWVTVAALTAMPCTDVARGADPGYLQRVADLLIAPAWAGHGEGWLPAWQVKGSQVVALHTDATSLHGLASEAAESLCKLHLLLGHAESDAPTLANLPDDVTMSRMTLHLELAWADGRSRTVRTDIGWGDVLVAAPALAAGNGEATVTLRPRAALLAASAEVDLANASDKDAGRAYLEALVETATAGYAPEL